MADIVPVKKSWMGRTPSGNSKADRVEVYSKPLSIQKKAAMRGAVNRFASNLAITDVHEDRALDPMELADLMDEYKALEEAQRIAEARHARIKQMLFTHFDHTGKSEEEVEGRKFKREGGGTKDPTIDLEIFKREFSNWGSFVDIETTEVVNEDRLEEYIASRPDEIEPLRNSLIPGKQNSYKFAVREVKDDNQQD